MKCLVTGGSGNGKSTFAERLAVELSAQSGGDLVYLATMRPFGDGAFEKIERHREMRALKGFRTIERHTNVANVGVSASSTVLLECMCNLTANEMFDDDGNLDAGAVDRILADVLELSERIANLIVVTNDVGSDYRTYDSNSNAYVDALGRLGRELARRCDAVYEVVVGIPLLLKQKGEI